MRKGIDLFNEAQSEKIKKKKKNKMGVKWCRGEKMRIPTKVAGRVGVLRVEFNLFNLYFYIVLMCYY